MPAIWHKKIAWVQANPERMLEIEQSVYQEYLKNLLLKKYTNLTNSYQYKNISPTKEVTYEN